MKGSWILVRDAEHASKRYWGGPAKGWVPSPALAQFYATERAVHNSWVALQRRFSGNLELSVELLPINVNIGKEEI